MQYQFVLPKSGGFESLRNIIAIITRSNKASFLATLKAFGEQNNNLLSFPMKGLTMALDFKITPGVFALLDELDKVVVQAGGRIYLTKDARMSEATFKQSYPNWREFVRIREEMGVKRYFNSLQSERLGI